MRYLALFLLQQLYWCVLAVYHRKRQVVARHLASGGAADDGNGSSTAYFLAGCGSSLAEMAGIALNVAQALSN
jgi:hypothetical protein